MKVSLYLILVIFGTPEVSKIRWKESRFTFRILLQEALSTLSPAVVVW